MTFFATSARIHWLLERLSALLLIALTYWPLRFVERCMHAQYAPMLDWLHLPLNKGGLILWFWLVCYHSQLGMQSIFTDYLTYRYQLFAIWSAGLFFTGLALGATLLLAQF